MDLLIFGVGYFPFRKYIVGKNRFIKIIYSIGIYTPFIFARITGRVATGLLSRCIANFIMSMFEFVTYFADGGYINNVKEIWNNQEWSRVEDDHRRVISYHVNEA